MKKMIIILVAVVVLGASGFVTFRLLNKEKPVEVVEQYTEEEKTNIYDLIINGDNYAYEQYLNDGKKLSFAFETNDIVKPTPLDMLIEANDILNASKLIDNGFDLTLVNNNHIDTVTTILAHNQQLNYELVDQIAIKLIYQIKDEIENEDSFGYSLLINAIETNNKPLVEEVLKYITDINKVYNDETALTFATLNGETNLEIIQLLVNSGADVNQKTKNGENSLMKAMVYEQTEVIEYLLTETNVNVNLTNDNGQTVLHVAVDNSNFIGIDLLLEHSNINKAIVDNYGKTAKDYASDYSVRQPKFNEYMLKL